MPWPRPRLHAYGGNTSPRRAALLLLFQPMRRTSPATRYARRLAAYSPPPYPAARPANAVFAMLPIQALLNPAPPERRTSRSRQPTPVSKSVSTVTADRTTTTTTTMTTASRDTMDSQPTVRKTTSRSASRLVRSRTHGPVRFPPHEQVDAGAMREVARFQISQFGQIYQYSQHIPYNSTKRNFYEKTGRESIEAFGYEFRIPGQQAPYKVMWDYNIGLVRMTPFFKCLGYPKMLDKNPGLREVSPSITGGSVGAQEASGYWVPYRCARALCATFCYDIAGALIPLFGPSFPSECTPPESPYFGDMVISQHFVSASKMEAEACRNAHEERKSTTPGGWLDSPSFPPRREECGTPWFNNLVPAAMPVVGWNPGPLSRAEGGTLHHHHHHHHHRHPDGDIRLPPINLSSSQFFNRFRDPIVPAAPNTCTTESWVAKPKRRWPYQDGSDVARAKSARLLPDGPPQQGEEINAAEKRRKTTDEGGDDYAAAAVLVELQKDDHPDAYGHPPVSTAG
ncbi:hypothetical protein XA68_13218 [Ophiocordyceps unilateralis]|uniref:HTH APSES-type domain-containing protein n=1 Tax=Ophiocordyceps unilateralis TaxID=268505 RepID=A0A2A9PD80_OPHUN|nr:hypothetical protein XA68_13218 [Ophiocordyceps unilateralis]